MARVGATRHSLSILVAAKPSDGNDFSWRAVYGNFLRRLEIIQQAYASNLRRVLILEYGAIFSRQFDKMPRALFSGAAN
ncbi:hypothetical protein CQ14_08540 [Bradyrhizobium lablabi]|uniref:Uncharacterized protein n=1 Tax=Bradyrhizobium lablabi TaxID=722472 RepID=A0A0R3N5Z4_9BRAD|nr:hypothetical protein CQ14_08540 [Bradyrhizobium lablabi]